MGDGKVIAVFGASGAQGGSVARALLSDGSYRVRALSRKPRSRKLKPFKDQGAEVAGADQDDPDSLQRALTGAYGCFIVTDYWETMDKDREMTQGLNAVKAARECGVEHIVFSGLENCQRHFHVEVGHFDGKGRVVEFLQEHKYPFTSVRLPEYYDHFVTPTPPEKTSENTYVLDIPMGDKPMAAIAVDDIGQCVLGVFNNRDKYLGKCIGLAGDDMPVSGYAEALGRVFPGKTFLQGPLTTREMAAQSFPGAADLAAMYDLYMTGMCVRSVAASRELYPHIQNFETWLKANKEKMAVVLK